MKKKYSTKYLKCHQTTVQISENYLNMQAETEMSKQMIGSTNIWDISETKIRQAAECHL